MFHLTAFFLYLCKTDFFSSPPEIHILFVIGAVSPEAPLQLINQCHHIILATSNMLSGCTVQDSS
jgi:hypothetical protein